MANGYCPSLLAHINSIAECASPGRKLTPAGLIKMLLGFQNSTASLINSGFDNATGHTRTLTVKYRERPLSSQIQDSEDCEVDVVPVWKEWSLPGLSYREFSFFLEDTEIQKYCSEASGTVSAGRPASQFMTEHFDYFVTAANAILKSINSALVTAMATKFGTNVTINSADGKVINISKDADEFALDDGLIAILQDLRENEICEDLAIVGGGLYSNFDLSRIARCCNAAGFDMGRLSVPTFYFDKETQPIWGQNSIGVFSQGSAKMLNRNRYVGAFAGQKGNSFFFTMPLPVSEYCCLDSNLSNLVFDVQMRYLDCPQTITIDGSPTAVGRGWQVIVSKYFGLWTVPDDAYQSGDDLEGTNGTLKYFIQNESSNTGGAYAYAP